MTALVVLEGVVVLLLGLLVVGLLRSHAEILRRLERLDPGGAATPTLRSTAADLGAPPGVTARRPGPPGELGADVTGLRPDGANVVVGVVGANHPTLLAFLTSGCTTCAGFWEALGRGGAADLPDGDVHVVAVTKGPEAEQPAAVARLAPGDLTTVMSSAAWQTYGVPVSPYFVLVDGPSGRVVGEGAAATWEQMVGLLRRVVADTGWAPGPDARPGRAGRPGPADRADRRRQAEARVDGDLLRAGIVPGHPSLYPDHPPPAPPPTAAADGEA